VKILVDADACPVKDIIEDIAGYYNLQVIMISNPSHNIRSSYSDIIMVDGGAEAVDIAVANRSKAGDIVVTQDYGLASMVLGKGAAAINPSGKIYTMENIDGLLMQRYLNYKARKVGLKTINPRKRSAKDDQRFTRNFTELIEKLI
jgi:hypothetical protein